MYRKTFPKSCDPLINELYGYLHESFRNINIFSGWSYSDSLIWKSNITSVSTREPEMRRVLENLYKYNSPNSKAVPWVSLDAADLAPPFVLGVRVHQFNIDPYFEIYVPILLNRQFVVYNRAVECCLKINSRGLNYK